MLTLTLAVIQLLGGLVTYVYPKLSASRRAAAYPYHAFLGSITFAMPLATMLTGIQEKASFVQVWTLLPDRGSVVCRLHHELLWKSCLDWLPGLPQVFMKAPLYSPAIRLPAALALFVALTGILLAAYHAAVRKQQQEEAAASDAVEYERVV